MSTLKTLTSRRGFILGTGALATTAACGNGVGSNGSSRIDARVSQTVQHMYSQFPGTRDLARKSVGMLVMPLITEAGFGIGGSFGRGALQIDGGTVDYYSAASGSFGLQIGAKQFAHVLFFMTNEALYDFRNSHGWAAGADLEYAVSDQGGDVSADTTTALSPVIAAIFGQAGLHIGATLEGTKYTRIIP
ncbi:YSC84-related protein [Halocynthiibacter sp.]|uniref:lipid-binding SYLF domain-containing protein n=1 Tax=Halocynthiibacter sp. TaxID=1979210 RepID=UPI003C33758F